MHVPVLLKEAVYGLNLRLGDKVIDATYGDGGHARAILEKIGPTGKLLGIDIDPENIKRASQTAANNLLLVNDNFVNLKKIVAKEKFGPVRAILLDLGWSSRQLKESGRGFSFAKDEPLDLRLSGQGPTAADILDDASKDELGRIFREYGEEKKWLTLASAIVRYRRRKKIEHTAELVKIIFEALGLREGNPTGRRHPATKVWQALRLAVNQELANLQAVLPPAVEILPTSGRLAVITFHSLEDRIVKQFFKSQAGRALKLINKKPIIASRAEVQSNPASRSAKLRIIEKVNTVNIEHRTQL